VPHPPSQSRHIGSQTRAPGLDTLASGRRLGEPNYGTKWLTGRTWNFPGLSGAGKLCDQALLFGPNQGGSPADAFSTAWTGSRVAGMTDADLADPARLTLGLEPWQVLLPRDEVVYLLDVHAAEPLELPEELCPPILDGA
jgi:hypothetical protein